MVVMCSELPETCTEREGRTSHGNKRLLFYWCLLIWCKLRLTTSVILTVLPCKWYAIRQEFCMDCNSKCGFVTRYLCWSTVHTHMLIIWAICHSISVKKPELLRRIVNSCLRKGLSNNLSLILHDIKRSFGKASVWLPFIGRNSKRYQFVRGL